MKDTIANEVVDHLTNLYASDYSLFKALKEGKVWEEPITIFLAQTEKENWREIIEKVKDKLGEKGWTIEASIYPELRRGRGQYGIKAVIWVEQVREEENNG